MIVDPRESFMTAWAGELVTLLPQYRIEVNGFTPTSKDECPKVCIQYIGDSSVELSSGSRSRRETAMATIHVGFHKWIEKLAPSVKSALLAEYGRNYRVLAESLRQLRVNNKLPDGIQITGRHNIKGKAFKLDANSQSTVVSSLFLIEQLPLEYTISED